MSVSPATPDRCRTAALETLLRGWQRRLQLTHWRITLAEEPLDPEVDRAVISRDTPYDYATLRLAANWQTWTPRELNATVAHELLHLHTRDLEEAVEAVEPLLDESAKLLWQARYLHESEALVDRLATVLVDLAGEL